MNGFQPNLGIYSLMTAIWKIWSELPQAFTLTGWGKNRFWDRLWTLTQHICATEHDIDNRKETCQSTGTPIHAFQILWTLVQKRLRTVGKLLPTPNIFTLGDTASLTTWTSYNRQQAQFGTCCVVARAYSLEQQNAGRTHAGLCHAYSYVCFSVVLSSPRHVVQKSCDWEI